MPEVSEAEGGGGKGGGKRVRPRGVRDTGYSRRALLQVTVPGQNFSIYRKKLHWMQKGWSKTKKPAVELMICLLRMTLHPTPPSSPSPHWMSSATMCDQMQLRRVPVPEPTTEAPTLSRDHLKRRETKPLICNISTTGAQLFPQSNGSFYPNISLSLQSYSRAAAGASLEGRLAETKYVVQRKHVNQILSLLNTAVILDSRQWFGL